MQEAGAPRAGIRALDHYDLVTPPSRRSKASDMAGVLVYRFSDDAGFIFGTSGVVDGAPTLRPARWSLVREEIDANYTH